MLKKENIYLLIILFIYIIALYPLTKVGINVGDNMDLFIQNVEGRWGEIVGELPYNQGRFYLLFMPWVYTLPYLIDSPLYFYPIYIIPLLLCFFSFSLFVKKLFNNKYITLLASLILISTFQLNRFHSVTTSYPFYFSFSFSLILFSFILLINYYENNKKSNLLYSAILMFLASLFYETYLVFYLAILFIILWKRDILKKPFQKDYLLFFKDLLPFIIGGTAYLIPYFTFRYYYPPQYIGLKIVQDISFSGLFSTCFDLTYQALPLTVYYDLQGLVTSSYFSGINLLFLFISILISLLFFLILKNIGSQKPIKLIILFLLGLFFAISSQVFVSLTEKYYLKGLYNYIPTYFAFFAYSLSFLSLIVLLNICLNKNKIINIVYRLIIALLVFHVSINTFRINDAIANDIQLSSQRFEIVRTIIDKDIIPDIENQTICFEQLHGSESVIAQWVTLQSFTWKDFIYRVSKKKTNTYDSYSEFYFDNYNLDKMVWVAYLVYDFQNYKSIVYLANMNSKDLKPNCKDNIPKRLIKVNSNSTYFEISPLNIISNLKIYEIEKFKMDIEDKELIRKVMKNIEENQQWANAIKEKAKGKNVSFTRQLRDDAIWFINTNK